MNYELKDTNPATVKLNQDGTAKINIGFTTGVVGCPYPMVVGDSIEVIVENYTSKTVVQSNIEVMEAINSYIQNKYPNT
jgi:metal-sulfur cluster biosynthetic enzyme